MRDRVSDPRRIAQLLASEVDGRDRGGYAALAVADADRGAEPSPAGTEAYVVARDGDPLATATLYPDRLALVPSTEAVTDAARERGLPIEGGAVTVPDGAAVKRAGAALADAGRETR